VVTRVEQFKPMVKDGGDLELARRERSRGPSSPAPELGAVSARLHGFDLDECPVLAGLAALPGELVRARTTIALNSQHIGAELLVLFESGDARRPVVIGVLQRSRGNSAASSAGAVTVSADAERYVIRAEREIVLECGSASVTLTRAGKVVIKGSYIVSRSSGYNRIKGAAVDIN
jgi:hypothetical protein